jgi:3-oxoacyl-[acyl-carrier protein] reductase
VKAPIDILGLSNGARSGLTGFVAGVARQPRLAGRNVTLNACCRGLLTPTACAARPWVRPARAAAAWTPFWTNARQANPSRRFGTRDEFGALCAFICSVHAGYITGQNLLLDGGAYPGTF